MNLRLRASVLECGSPLPPWKISRDRQRQRALVITHISAAVALAWLGGDASQTPVGVACV